MKKRFIAGAQCPKCQEQDSIMLFVQAGVEVMECVSCGYRQSQVSEPEQAMQARKATSAAVIGLFKPE